MSLLSEITTKQLIIRLEDFKSGYIVDLSGLDMRKTDLRGSEIRNLLEVITKEVSKSDSGYIDFSYSNISGRDFSKYDLSHVIMTKVIAEHTIFAEANLSDTQLDGAMLDYADFRGADMRYTKLYNTSLKGVNFSKANLINTYGLYMGVPGKETIKRLSVVSSIYGTIFPKRVEKLREEIQNAMDKNNPKSPQKKHLSEKHLARLSTDDKSLW